MRIPLIEHPSGRLCRALALLALLGLFACADEPASPEEHVRALITQAETAAEQRDLDALKALISDAYRDDRGNAKQNIATLINFYFLQNRSIHLLTRLDTLAFADSAQAEARLFVALAAQPIGEASLLSLARAALYRFDVTVVDEGNGAWRVTQAAWQRAEAGDFLF